MLSRLVNASIFPNRIYIFNLQELNFTCAFDELGAEYEDSFGSKVNILLSA